VNVWLHIFQIIEDKLIGKVKLIDDNFIDLVLKKDQKIYENTKYGMFQILLLDLTKMIRCGSKKRN